MPSPARSSSTTVQDLGELLFSLFSSDELRRFLRYNYPEVHESVSFDQPPHRVSREAADALGRRGLIDSALFSRLGAERPGRVTDIEAVARSVVEGPKPASRAHAWDVFISCSFHDVQFARELAEALRDGGRRAFLYEEAVVPGEVVPDAIFRALDESASGIVLLSPSALRSEWVRHERTAMASRSGKEGFRLVPVLLPGVDFAQIPPDLSVFRALDARSLTAGEVAHALAPVLPRQKGFGERVIGFLGSVLGATERVARDFSLQVADPELRDLATRFFTQARRTPTRGSSSIDLLVPEPVVCRTQPTGTAVDLLSNAVPSGSVGYLVHKGPLAVDVELRLDVARVHGRPIVALPESLLMTTLADGRCRVLLDSLTAEARAAQNLFRSRNSVIDRRLLFGRALMLTKIGSALREGEHILLTGSRKSGKTSVLNILRQDLADHPVASLDLQVVDRADERWPTRLFREVLAAYDRWGQLRFGDWPEGERFPPDGSAFRDQLALRREWHAVRSPNVTRFLLLVDELERVVPADGDVAAASALVRWSGALRAISQGNDRWLSIIAADLRPTANRANTLPGGQTNPFFQFFQELPLPLLDRAAVAEMLEVLARMMGANVDVGMIERVFALSGGHPWVARTLAAAAWDAREPGARLTGAELDRGLEALADDDVLGSFFHENFWAPLTPLERGALRSIAAGQAARSIPSEVRASLRRQGLLVESTIPIGVFASWIRDQADWREGVRGM